MGDLGPQRGQRSSVAQQPASNLRERVPFEFQLTIRFGWSAYRAEFLRRDPETFVVESVLIAEPGQDHKESRR